MLKHRRRSFWNRVIAGLMGAACLGISHAAVVTIAYDGIDYAPHQLLEGENGGTGWTAPWRFDYIYGENFVVLTPGLTYPGLATSGGAMYWTSGGNGISANDRSLPLQNSGVVYVQFLSDFGPNSALGTPNVRLLHEGNYVAGFGGNGGTYQAVMSILDGNLTAKADGTSSSAAPLDQLNLVIVRIDYLAQSTSMWVNPNLEVFNYDLPSAPDAVFAGLAPAFDAVGAYTRNPGTVDEIRVVALVPEPTAGILALLGGLALFGRRLLRR